jgi:hypothetical protein
VPKSGGEGRIRTHDEVAPIPVFEIGRSMSGRKTPAQMGSDERTLRSPYEFDAGSGILASLSCCPKIGIPLGRDEFV